MFPKTKVEDLGQKLFSIIIITASYFLQEYAVFFGSSLLPSAGISVSLLWKDVGK